ncbi:MAG: oligosaccharide flippase family protein [Crocosphaera sp.]|nr:oligosaccharide flippase family protein [Crocosphaera sp.]
MSFLKNKAISGSIWTLVGYGGGQVFRLGANLILTRLLVPELFGLMALVSTFIQGLQLFSDLGIKPSIIRSPRGDDPIFLNTAWTLQVIRGFGLWIGCCLIAWPVSQFYGNQQLLWLIPTVGLNTIMSGFNSTSLATLNRKLEIGKLTILELGVQILTLSIMIVWAYFQRSIWALVVGNLVSVFLKMVMSHRLEPNISNRFVWDQKSIKEISSFGSWIFISTAMTFLANQADRILLGKLLSLEILGIYTIATTFSFLPQQVVSRLGVIILPLVAKNQHLPRNKLLNKILRKRRLILIVLATIVAGLFCGGDLIILTLYDDRYKDATWMLPILSLGIWPVVLNVTIRDALIAIGKPKYLAWSNILKFCYMLIMLPLGYYLMKLPGIIICVAFNDILPYFVFSYGLWRESLSPIKQDILASFGLILLIICILATRNLLGLGLPLSNFIEIF